jgi:transcriptional regulator with XRE-family HTH domain
MYKVPIPPIKRCRLLSDLTQWDVAKVVGRSHVWWSLVERGMRPVPPDVARRISRFFQTPVEELFSGPNGDGTKELFALQAPPDPAREGDDR